MLNVARQKWERRKREMKRNENERERREYAVLQRDRVRQIHIVNKAKLTQWSRIFSAQVE